jgi:hypothetical protein
VIVRFGECSVFGRYSGSGGYERNGDESVESQSSDPHLKVGRCIQRASHGDILSSKRVLYFPRKSNSYVVTIRNYPSIIQIISIGLVLS